MKKQKLTPKQKEQNRQKAIKELVNMIKNPKIEYLYTFLKGLIPVFIIMSIPLIIQSRGIYCIEETTPELQTEFYITQNILNLSTNTPIIKEEIPEIDKDSHSYHYYYKKYETDDGQHRLPRGVMLNCTWNLTRLWKETIH